MSKYIYAVLILIACVVLIKPVSAISTSSSCQSLAYDIRFMVPIHHFSYEPAGNDAYLAERLDVTALKPHQHHLKGVPEPSTLMMLGLGILALMHKILISYN